MIADDHIEGIPPLTGEEIADGMRGLTDYIFVKSDDVLGAKRCFCTACKKSYLLAKPQRLWTPEDEALYTAKHRTEAACPKCHKVSMVVNRGIKKRLDDMRDEKCVAYISPKSADEVWIRCTIYHRNYYDDHVDDYGSDYEVYRVVKGEGCTYWRASWGSSYERRKTIRDPFGFASMSYLGFIWRAYRVIGAERIGKTFLRYSKYEPQCNERDVPLYRQKMAYLDVFAKFPRAVEMLEKRGYYDLVEAKVLGHKTRHVCNWGATDYRRFWRITPDEVKALGAYHGSPLIAEAYKRYFRAKGAVAGMALARVWVDKGYGDDDRVAQTIKRLGVDAEKLVKYMDRQTTWQTICYYIDYVEAAEAIGYDLTVHNVLFPRDLQTAHDEAVKARKIKEDEEEIEKSMARAAALETQYGYTDGVYLIRPPKSTTEIIDEGNALQHCVGGYAARHANGITTILFMRACAEPDKPLYTIEMHGKELRQAHGYQNRKNPEDVPETKAFLDRWIAWVKDGSKRDKNGAPRDKTASKRDKKATSEKGGKKKGIAA